MIPLALFLATAIVHLPKAHAQSALSYLFVGAGVMAAGTLSYYNLICLTKPPLAARRGGGNGTLNVQNDGTLVLG